MSGHRARWVAGVGVGGHYGGVRWSWVVGAVVGVGGVGVAAGQWQKNEAELEAAAATHLEPAPLVARRWAAAGAEVRALRVRFYADAEYRAAGVHWQDRVRGQLAELNALLTPAFAIRLEADGFRRWDRRDRGAGDLSGLLDQLQAFDSGEDVDWVVGLVSPLPLLSQSMHELGAARTPGRHLVVRAMSSVAELDQLRHMFPHLGGAAREKLYGRRKGHKERAVFLHEWAHSLGIGHSENPTHVMSPGYSHRTSVLDETQCDRISSALAKRQRPGRAPGSVADPTLPRLPRPGALTPPGARPPALR